MLLMSRTSPGATPSTSSSRTCTTCRSTTEPGARLPAERPNASEWEVAGHSGVVRVRYKVFGDPTDGTYLGIDTTHAHINIPAALMWARGLENRAARVTFQSPPGASWKVATQLHATDDPYTFTAANLYYLIDSPTEVSDFALRSIHGRSAFPHRAASRRQRSRCRSVRRRRRADRAGRARGVRRAAGLSKTAYTFIVDYCRTPRAMEWSIATAPS